MSTILDDGMNVLGAATPRPATPTGPGEGEVAPQLVELVASMTVDQVGAEIRSGNLTSAEVLAAEDPGNGGRGRSGIRSLTGG